jgi:hypothetical protein
MTSKSYHLLTIITLFSVFLPSGAIGQANPRILLEKSASYALDNKMRAFRAPVTNSAGVVKYYDVTVTLGVNTNGVVMPSASVAATPSLPIPSTGVIPPGTYKASDGDTCTVTNIVLTNGRIQSFFSCKDGARVFELSLATGPVSAGHPFLDALLAAGINARPDVNTPTPGGLRRMAPLLSELVAITGLDGQLALRRMETSLYYRYSTI